MRFDPELTAEEKRAATAYRYKGRAVAKKLFPVQGVMCELCEIAPARDRHHIDEDTHNNDRSNVQLLCAPCHIKIHSEQRRKPLHMRLRPCVHCSDVVLYRWAGRCGTCNAFFKRTGSERLLKHEKDTLSPPDCQRCGKLIGTKGWRGYCVNCRRFFKLLGVAPPPFSEAKVTLLKSWANRYKKHKECEECGALYDPATKHQRFCRNYCRTRAHIKKHRQLDVLAQELASMQERGNR